MPSLIVVKSPGGDPPTGKIFPLQPTGMVLGREAVCEVHIENNSVSRQHAKITVANGQYIIEDLGSLNKTFLNNKLVTGPTTLRNQDRIKICDYLFTFSDDIKAEKSGIKKTDSELNDEDEELSTRLKPSAAGGAAMEFLSVQPSEKLRALLDISTSLSRTLELEPLFNQIADTLFGVFRQADRCFIISLEEERLVTKIAKSRRRDRDDERFSKTIVRKCLESRQAFLSSDATSDSALRGAGESIVSLQIRSVMCVPLLTSDSMPLGAIQLDTHDAIKKFNEDDLRLLSIVANLASVAIEKAKVHAALVNQEKQQREIEIARSVQLGFLPQATPEVHGYDFYHFYSAAQSVGGDYYDFIPLPGGKIAAVLGDVAGKGVPASLLMAKLSAEVRYSLLTEPDLAKAICLLNDQLIRGGIGDRFVTLAALVIDPHTHELTIVNAGHINPQRYHFTKREFDEPVNDDVSGLPLGLVPGFEYQAVSIHLAIGEAILLFTDGVTDAMNKEGVMFGFEGVKESVGIFDESAIGGEFDTPVLVGERLVKAVRQHANGQPQNDDIALISFGRIEKSNQKTSTSLNPQLEKRDSNETGAIPHPERRYTE